MAQHGNDEKQSNDHQKFSLRLWLRNILSTSDQPHDLPANRLVQAVTIIGVLFAIVFGIVQSNYARMSAANVTAPSLVAPQISSLTPASPAQTPLPKPPLSVTTPQALPSPADTSLVDLWAPTPPGILSNKRAGFVTVEAVQRALDAGANPDARNSDYDETTLCYAAHNGLKDVALLLLSRGAQVDATNKDDITPLMEAAVCSEVPTAQVLIDKGAQVNFRNRGGKSPLIVAASFCRADFVAFLLENGAEVNTRDIGGRSALYDAENPSLFYGQPASDQAQADTISVLKAHGAVE